ncbi:MAG: SDR family oxidoreductase [Anaerolineales bacterium]|nr:SDR family oxidoreductase [Anaerolineales bacterium]
MVSKYEMSIQTAVITGASTGIGAACALYLDRLGWRVFAGVRKPADGDALRQQASDRLTPLLLDVTDSAAIAAAAAAVTAAVGETGLTGLVNNAGIAQGGPLEFLPMADLRRQFEINVIGQIAVTQAFLPLLRQGRGRVVNMGSVSGRVAMPFMGPYAASKFALEALTDSLRVELRPWGIHVAIIEPGPIATPIWQKSLATADELSHALPPAGQTLYGAAIARARQRLVSASQAGSPAEAVARVVAHALTAQRPQTRYPLGRGVRLAILFARFTPDRLRDWLITR